MSGPVGLDPELQMMRARGLHLVEHTDQVGPHTIFVCISTNIETAHAYCKTALEAGVEYFVLDSLLRDLIAVEGLEHAIYVANLAANRGQLAALYYGQPSQQMTCVGITGTNGKTSVAYHVANLYEQLGGVAGYCGTLGCGRLSDLKDAGMTTPDPTAVQRYLAELLAQDCTLVAMEVSSHALDQGRVDAVAFDVAVFTNLSRDHLDYHETMEAYFAAKARLFKFSSLQHIVCNIDAPYGLELAQQLANSPAQLTTVGGDGDWTWQRVDGGVEISHQQATLRSALPLVADFQFENVTAAIAGVVAAGAHLADIEAVLSQVSTVPGRLQPVHLPDDQRGDSPLVVVDYAHTPDALHKALLAFREGVRGDVTCVVGCGGDRDVGKRPRMGCIAAQHSDHLIVTSDNPRSEDPARIAQDMLAELPDGVDVVVELDRKRAIAAAIHAAGAADGVLIAGKGHENYQEINGSRYPFDDYEVARSLLMEVA